MSHESINTHIAGAGIFLLFTTWAIDPPPPPLLNPSRLRDSARLRCFCVAGSHFLTLFRNNYETSPAFFATVPDGDSGKFASC